MQALYKSTYLLTFERQPSCPEAARRVDFLGQVEAVTSVVITLFQVYFLAS